MRKIAIVTFCNANNCGAVLQAFALEQYLIGKNNEVEFLNVKFNPSNSKKASSDKKSIKQRIQQKIRRNIFSSFNKRYLKISQNIIFGDNKNNMKESEYDMYIVGSDQVWNTDITNKTKAFFLDFIKNTPKVAYAASYGKSDINDIEKEWTYEAVKSFKSISLREKKSADYINSVMGGKVEMVCDPVFLLSSDKWIKSMNLKKNHGNYVLVYYMEVTEGLKKAVALAKKDGKKIIAVKGGEDYLHGIHHISICGPRLFLKLIYNADCIITNSFHACAFSMIFRKNILAVGHSKWNLRLSNLLRCSDMADKLINNKSIVSNSYLIDGNVAYDNLTMLINNSKKYLDKALS